MQTITLYLTEEIITSFSASFNSPQEEQAFLFRQASETINKSAGDVFLKGTCMVTKVRDGKQNQESTTLSEIGFETAQVSQNSEWRAEDLAGSLVPYTVKLGDLTIVKINKYCKLVALLNRILNQSMIDELKNKESPDEKSKEIIEQDIQKLEKLIGSDCMENQYYTVFSRIIFDKIKEAENAEMKKEQEELAKSLTEEETAETKN